MAEMFKKDVTDSEIEILMKPVEQEMSKFLVSRIIIERPANTKQQKAHKKKEQVTVSGEQREYLKSIREHPNLSSVARSDWHGLSAHKHTKIKRELKEKNLIQEFSVDLGKQFGGIVKLLKLTDNGYKILGKKPAKAKHPKQGSLEHQWWQEFIAKDYISRGYKAVIEKNVNGKCADIGIITETEIVAVEVELTPKNAITNFKQNIDAGFTRTIIACKNYRVKKLIEKKISSFIEQNPRYRDKAKIILLTEFPFVKKLKDEIRG